MKGYIGYIVFLPKVFETKKEKVGVKYNYGLFSCGFFVFSSK